VILALTGNELAWWITLAVGLVVAVVVWVLLELLRRTVHDVRRAVDDVLVSGGRLAQHTWTVQILQTAVQRADKLLEELRSKPSPERSGG
jgi:hypothetical protein